MDWVIDLKKGSMSIFDKNIRVLMYQVKRPEDKIWNRPKQSGSIVWRQFQIFIDHLWAKLQITN